jgi:hypothetical protein
LIINLTQDKQFAKELRKALKSESTMGVRGQKVGEDSVIVADLGTELTDEHKDVIHVGMDNESTLVLKNCNSEKMAEFALFGVNAGIVVLKSMDSGRRQDMVVLGAVNGPRMDAWADQTVAAEPNSLSERIDSDLAKGVALRFREPEEVEKFEDDGITSSDEAKPSDTHMIARLVEGLNFRSRIAMETRGLNPINASQASGRVIFAEKSWRPNKRSRASIFGSFTVELAAVLEPVKSKYIKITSVGTAVNADPKWDDGRNRGDFTLLAEIRCYPGTKMTWDKNSIRLPDGWRRIAIAPETPNLTSTYTKTTGGSIGGKGGAEVAIDPKITAELEASYSESNSTTDQITDFRVKNFSNAAVCHWQYEYSKVIDDWTSMFIDEPFRCGRVHGLAGLSKSTMFLRNEAIYEAPEDAQGCQRFIFELGQRTARLLENGNWAVMKMNIEYDAEVMWNFLDVNLGMVRHP